MPTGRNTDVDKTNMSVLMSCSSSRNTSTWTKNIYLHFSNTECYRIKSRIYEM